MGLPPIPTEATKWSFLIAPGQWARRGARRTTARNDAGQESCALWRPRNMLKPCLNLTPGFTWLARTRVSSKVHPPFMDSSRLLALEAAKCRSGPCPSAWPSVFATVRVLSIALGAKLFSEIWLLSTITSSQTDPSHITHDTTTSTGTLDLTTRRDRTLT